MATPAPVDVSSFTPAQMSAFNSANALGSGVQTTGAPTTAQNQPATPSTTYNSGNGAQMAPNGSPVAAPAGAQQSANGLWYINGNAYQLPPAATPNYSTGNASLTANISNPADTGSTSTPAVITSNAATTDLANKQTQVAAVNNDVANQANTQAATTAANAGTGAGASTSTNSGTGSSPDTSNTGIPDLDSQINSLLSGLTDQTNTINTNATNSENGILSEEDQNQLQQNQQYAQTASQLSAIASGTYPLSPAEQQLLTATAQAYQQTIAAQNTANQAYTGQMAEAMASLGISTSAPTQAMGQIQAAINSGQSKIAAIDGQMATSLANLQLGFQKQDFDMVQSAWEDAAKQFEDRQSELQNMLSTVQTQAKNQVDELNTQTQMNLTAMTDSANFTYKAKQDAITNALAAKTLDEKTADDLQKNLIAEYTAGMVGSNGSPSGAGNGLPNVAVDSTGKPDPISQAAFLAQFPPQTASLIQGVANYSINPSSIPTSKKQAMGGMTQSQIVALASQYNPNYDEKQYATRAAMQKNITSGQYSQTITAANTLIQHLAKLNSDYAALGNGTFDTLNAGKNALQSFGGSGNQTAVATDIAAVASEAAKIYKGTGSATDQEITDWQNSISPNASPAQMKAAITSITDLMGGKLSVLSDNYQQVMGQPGNFQILTDTSAANLKALGIDPSTVDPTYGNSPTVKLSNFYSSDPKNSALIDQLIQADPSLKADPAKMIDTLNANGIQL